MRVDVPEYESIRQKHLARFGELVPEYLQHLAWPRQRIEEEQSKALRRIVGVALERSPWHRERLRGVDVDRLDLAHLQSLPTMTKDDLMSHWNEVVTDPRLTLALVDRHLQTITSDAYLFDAFHAVASGGSSGRRGVFVWGWDAWAIAFACGVRWSIRHAMQHPELATRLPVIATIAASGPTHMTAAMTQTFAAEFPASHRLPVTMPMKEIVARLNEVQPTQLRGYASALHELARAALDGDLRIAPTTVAPDGEPLFPEMRATMERAWGAPVGGLYGTSEACVTASSCFVGGGMHVSEDVVLLEPVDADGRPVEPGRTSSRVYLTNLFNTALPLLRYEITDEVRVLPDPCPCGSAFARVDDIQGRLDHVFEYGDVVVHPHVFRSPLSRVPEILEYQVRQTRAGADIAVRTSSEVDLASLRSMLAEHVEGAGLPHPEIRIERVDVLGRTGAGKLKRFVPL
jgi:phenylacetate-coenzyme A ligase PaaK-like adenylate-forming protein